jgi:transcriptional regulator with XRE-family HTH domain
VDETSQSRNDPGVSPDPTDAGKSPIAKAFAAKLRSARDARRLTQEQLAQLSGVDRTQIGRLESGAQIPRLDTFVRLAGALQIEPCELMGEVRWSPPDTSPGSFGT